MSSFKGIVELSSELDSECAPPRATHGQSFPAAFRREAVVVSAGASSATAVAVGAGDSMAESDADRMFAAMSEQDISQAIEEIRSQTSKKTLEILQRRVARTAAAVGATATLHTETTHAVLPSVVDSSSRNEELPVMQREISLPQIEHDKLAWTDPESKQEPRAKEPDFAQSVRAQSLRFGLDGEIMSPDAASEKTYNAGLHHHGEEPEKAGYNLEELLTLMRSQNEPQNLFAVQLLLRVCERICQGEYGRLLLYPEAGARSMTTGEGILWELLGMKLLVPFRICCFKRSLALREACRALLSVLCCAFADDAGLSLHQNQPHWGAVVFPSAPLFEDDDSEEMEKLDGLRCMVRQLDFLPLMDPRTRDGLACLCCVAGHSRSLSLFVSSRLELLDQVVSSVQLFPALSMKLLRLLLSADHRLCRLFEEKHVASHCWRYFLSDDAEESNQREAALLLRTMLLLGSVREKQSFIETLPELVLRVLSRRMRPELVCLLGDALAVSAAPELPAEVVVSLLCASVRKCRCEADSVAVLHCAASVARHVGDVRWIVAPLFAQLERGGNALWLGVMRLANANAEVLRELPSWLWSSGRTESVARSLSSPLVQADKMNRFQTQRRLRQLVKERENILLMRELLIAGHLSLPNPIAVFGFSFDLVSRLAIVGADEFLLIDFLERVLLNAQFLERVTTQMMSAKQAGNSDCESMRQNKMVCSSVLAGVKQSLFVDAKWLFRCRAVVGELLEPAQLDNLFASRDLTPLSSFVGSDWLFLLCKSDKIETVRGAMQMLMLAELAQSSQSLKAMSSISKLVKVFFSFFFVFESNFLFFIPRKAFQYIRECFSSVFESGGCICSSSASCHVFQRHFRRIVWRRSWCGRPVQSDASRDRLGGELCGERTQLARVCSFCVFFHESRSATRLSADGLEHSRACVETAETGPSRRAELDQKSS
jgi:hypothetical protein